MSSNLSSNFLQFNFDMAKGNGHIVYEFDDFRLNLGAMMLCRGAEEISLPPKAVRTLAVLVENQGEIVSKDELIEAVWEGSIVEDSNLSQYLYLLRKTLGTDPAGGPYIETLRRRGYRFTGSARLVHAEQTRIGGRGSVEGEAGNVIELADWTHAADEPAQRGEQAARAAGAGFPQRWAILFVVALAAAAGAAAFWQRSGAEGTVPANSELTFQRLTDGIVVEDATISPDGKYFAYHTIDGGVYHLWVQQAGQSTRAEVVPASKQQFGAKTFSPDSQALYFLASDTPGGVRSLYRVPTLGGPAGKILSGVDSPVSFSPDGREMVFGRWSKEAGRTDYVIRASDGSGSERILETVKIGVPWNGNATWSPDGRSIALERLRAGEDSSSGGCEIAVADLGRGVVASLPGEQWETCYRMQWRADGRGVYLIGTKKGDGMSTRRDQLYYVSYPDGRPQRITTDESRNQTDSLGVTADGGVLTVPYNRSSQIWAMDPKGSAQSAVQITSGLNDGRAGIAPLGDGRVAYVARTSGNLSIRTIAQDGSGQKQITVEPSVLEEVRSGGDGRFLVFSAIHGDSQHLFRIDPDGADMRQLTFGPGKEIDSSISHDAKWVAYASSRIATDASTLWKTPVDGGEPVPLNRANCSMPHFSPDGKLLSCVEDQKLIHIISAADGSPVISFEALPLSTLSFGARWTADGTAVAYIVTPNGIANIWTQPLAGGPPKPLTDFTSGSIYHFAYSLDGTRLFVARGQQIRDAILITTAAAGRK
jgi:Tol biopolymer transport system component/DNA-binding winged helix-turn-helix (wHTH) protein